MKKIVSLLLVAALCCCTMFSVFADEFVPSISYKDNPETEGAIDLVDSADKSLATLEDKCVQIVAVSSVMDTAAAERTEAEKLLAEVYQKLTDGSMKLPLDPAMGDMVIRDLIDVSLVCTTEHDHAERLAKDGTSIRITFDLGVGKETEVVVMSYADNKWDPAKSVVNNGDGTVICVFEHLCPVVFCVEADDATPPQTGDVNGAELALWAVLMLGSLSAVVTMLVYPHRKGSNRK